MCLLALLLLWVTFAHEPPERFERATCSAVAMWQWQCGGDNDMDRAKNCGRWCCSTRDLDVEIPWHCQRRWKWERRWELLSDCSVRSSPNLLGVKRILRFSAVYNSILCVSVRLFLSIWQTVSLDSQGNHEPQQTPRVESSICNPIVRDHGDNSSTRLIASSCCWLEPWGTREKMKNWWVKYDLYLIYYTPVHSSNLCGWVIS